MPISFTLTNRPRRFCMIKNLNLKSHSRYYVTLFLCLFTSSHFTSLLTPRVTTPPPYYSITPYPFHFALPTSLHFFIFPHLFTPPSPPCIAFTSLQPSPFTSPLPHTIITSSPYFTSVHPFTSLYLTAPSSPQCTSSPLHYLYPTSL